MFFDAFFSHLLALTFIDHNNALQALQLLWLLAVATVGPLLYVRRGRIPVLGAWLDTYLPGARLCGHAYICVSCRAGLPDPNAVPVTPLNAKTR